MRNSVFGPLFGAGLAALAGCSNPAVTPPFSAQPSAGAPAAGGRSVTVPVVQAGTTALAGTPAVAVPAGGASAAGSSGTAGPALAGSGAGLAAAGSGGTAATAGSGGAAGSNGATAGAGGASDADPLDLGNLIPGGGDSPAPAAGSCADLDCFDVFDCVLWHPDEAATCNFTACENFVCK